MLFGYFRNPCVYESAEALISLHASKAGAWRAMRAAMFAAAVEAREMRLRHGRMFEHDVLRFESFRIRPIEVLP